MKWSLAGTRQIISGSHEASLTEEADRPEEGTKPQLKHKNGPGPAHCGRNIVTPHKLRAKAQTKLQKAVLMSAFLFTLFTHTSFFK